MIRQICPHCFQPVELPDSAAGSAALCPKCKQPFPVPGAYTPTVDAAAGPAPMTTPAPSTNPSDRPPPPPGLAPNAVPGLFTSSGSTSSSQPNTASGYEKSCGISLCPRTLSWVPAVCLTLVLILTFFTWVGTYAGGNTIYSQNAWQTLFGGVSVNEVLSEEILADEAELKKQVRSNWVLMLPYMLVLLITVVAAWGERLIRTPEHAPLPVPITSQIKKLWPWRYAILAGLAASLLLLLSFQTWLGFGLESAVTSRIDKQFEEQIKSAETKTTKEQRTIQIKKGMAINQTGLDDTTALDLVLLAHVVAVIFLVALIWLERRGTKPPPRIVLNY